MAKFVLAGKHLTKLIWSTCLVTNQIIIHILILQVRQIAHIMQRQSCLLTYSKDLCQTSESTRSPFTPVIGRFVATSYRDIFIYTEFQYVNPLCSFQDWLETTCKTNAWKHEQSPIIWRELIDRGGKGMLLGGFSDFLEHVQVTSLSPLIDRVKHQNVASQNVKNTASHSGLLWDYLRYVNRADVEGCS